MICQNCKAVLGGTPKFCPKCGARIESSAAVAPTTKRCPQCGTENPFSAKFCKNDGFRFEDETAINGSAQEPAGEVPDAGSSSAEQPTLRQEPPPPPEDQTALPDEQPLLPEEPASSSTKEPDEGQSPDESQLAVERVAVICPKCGTPNAPGSRFCRKDGVPLAGASSVDAMVRSAEATNVVISTVPEPSQLVSANAAEYVTPLAQPSRSAKKGLLIGLGSAALLAAAATGGYVYWANRPAEPKVAAMEKTPGAAGEAVRPQAGESKPEAAADTPREGSSEPRDSASADAPTTPSDAEGRGVDAVAIHSQLTRQLAKAAMSSVIVTADSEGRVSLDGSVSTQQQKDRAIQWAFATYGVESVDASDLHVVPAARSSGPVRERNPVASQPSVQVPNAAAPGAADPARLEGEINRALRANGLGGVTAQVADNFTVTLKGSVRNAAQKEKAFQIVRWFPSATATKDRVFVVD